MSASASESERAREERGEETPLVSLNHVSFVCRSVSESVKFYEEVLGFASIRRPSSFNFEGAWLFNYGIGIHLLQCSSEEGTPPPRRKEAINPKDNHISFQCSDLQTLRRRLERMGVEYVTAVVEEGGVQVNQLFFHDPDGHMIEICNCEDLPVLPLPSASCPVKFLTRPQKEYAAASLGDGDHDQRLLPSSSLLYLLGRLFRQVRRRRGVQTDADAGEYSKAEGRCGVKVDHEVMIVENLCENMMHISL